MFRAVSAGGIDEAQFFGSELTDLVMELADREVSEAAMEENPDETMALLAAAARLVGPRAADGRLVLQTRMPDHHVVDAVLHSDPGKVAEVERELRSALSLPPFSAMASVSGAAAEAFMDAFDPVGAVTVARDDAGWLLRADDHDTLTAALRATPRPAGRLRIEVDPQRV